MKITMNDFGSNGRLGNCLFQYASLLGIANSNNKKLQLPSWDKAIYFTGKFPVKEVDFEYDNLEEEDFSYNKLELYNKQNYNLKGYYQSERYWEHCKDLVKEQLTFKDIFITETIATFTSKNGIQVWDKPTIAIHIRRGDYVNNPNYYQLPIHYYIQALTKNFINYESNYNIIFFSDDIEYCKTHFGCLHNAYFSEGNSDIEDLCLMSQCDNFILSNSSYSWWGAYLYNGDVGFDNDLVYGKVIRPNYLFDGALFEVEDDKDFWIKDWIVFDHKTNKIDLSDVNFTIPVSYDHNDRKENLQLCIDILNKNFITNIIVCEQGGNKFKDLNGFYIYLLDNSKDFHRTKMLNNMARLSSTHIIANWDADVFVPPMQLLKAVQQIRDGISDMVYPYDGRFGRIRRTPYYDLINKTKDIGIVKYEDITGISKINLKSVGGAVLFNKESFIKGGMENENFISFGAEDLERYERFTKLGFRVSRVSGILYHLNHFIGINSSKENPYFIWNQMEYIKVKLMSVKKLTKYILEWEWI